METTHEHNNTTCPVHWEDCGTPEGVTSCDGAAGATCNPYNNGECPNEAYIGTACSDGPVVVPATTMASEANRIYGEAYFVDWIYEEGP